ncbi:telomere length regulation protein-domain-containing protein [Umbelopsis sp. PMI_123]|nr:telomere length regulation protein-domain-containing protein [Umbelopsis sp. PMI_123]
MEKSHLDALHNRVRNSQSATLAFATNALSEPLSRVHTLPPQLEHFQSWQGPNDQSIDQLTTGSFWSCHLHFVVDTLIPNWSYAFEDGQRFQLLKATFVPYTRSKHATIMARQSLMILVDSLTQKTAPTGVLALSTRLLRLLMQEGGLDLLLGECYDAEWRSLVTAIVSIPARVANAIGQTSTHDDWYTDNPYSAIIANAIARYVDAAAQRCPPMDNQQFIDNVAASIGQLIGKMARQGYASSLIANLYPHTLPLVTSQSPHSAITRKMWSHIMLHHLMLSPDLTKLISGTFQYLEQRLSKTNLTSSHIQQLAQGIFAMYFGSEPVNSSNDVLQLFWKTGWLESHTSPSIGATRTLAALLVYAGGIQESQNFGLEASSYSITKRTQDILLSVLRQLISMWGDRQFVRNTPYFKQLGVTSAIFVILGYLPNQVIIAEVFSAMQMTRHIHEWFVSGDPETTKIGILVAETLSMMMDDPDKRLDCHVLESETDKNLLKLRNLIIVRDALQHEDVLDTLVLEESVKAAENEHLSEDDDQGMEEIDPDAPFTFGQEDDTSDEDSDLEPYSMPQESDDERDARTSDKKKLGKPMYVYDLLQYLRTPDDPIKQEIGLASAEALIRQKEGVGTEIEENAEDLTKTIFSLQDTFHLENFDQCQQDAIVALLVASPIPSFKVLIDEFYDRNSSDSQRSLALRCISVAVKELAGWRDTKTKEDSAAGSIESLNQAFANTLILPDDSTSNTTLEPKGKTRVFSRKSEVDRKRAKPTRNKLAGIVSTCIFFPLMQGWWEGTRTGWSNHTVRVMATQSPRLLSRFVLTLGIILHYSIHTPQHQHIVKEYWDFSLSLRYLTFQGRPEPSVIQAALTGINTILNTTMKDQKTRLINEYAQQLVETKDWIIVLVDSSTEEVKQLCGHILLALNDIMTTYNEILLGGVL